MCSGLRDGYKSVPYSKMLASPILSLVFIFSASKFLSSVEFLLVKGERDKDRSFGVYSFYSHKFFLCLWL